jgi:hypothetical protein
VNLALGFAVLALLFASVALALCLAVFLRAAHYGARLESLSESVARNAKNLRIAKAALLAARDAHAAKLDEHDERFALFPDREAVEKLVEQHNVMVRDLMALKDEFSTIRSGASLKRAVVGG